MSRIRVVIAEVPQLLGDIITGWLERHRDIEIAGKTSVREEMYELVERSRADVVIVACQDEEISRIGDQLFARRSSPRVLAITDEGRRAYLYELCPRMVPLGEASADRLVAVIRGNGRWPQTMEGEGVDR